MPINSQSSNTTAQTRIATFAREIANAGKPKVLKANGSTGAKPVDLAKPGDRPVISEATTVKKKMLDATERELDVLNSRTGKPPAPTPPARAKTPATRPAPPAPSKHRPAAAPAAPTPSAPAAMPTTTTVSAVSFASLADALGITKPRLGELMASGIVPREQFCTPDGAIYWEASAIPRIIEAVLKHRAKPAATPTVQPPAARPKAKTPAAFGEMLADLPGLCRRLAVSPEDVRRFIGMGLIPPGRPAPPGDPSVIYWPAASAKAIASAVKRHLAAAGK